MIKKVDSRKTYDNNNRHLDLSFAF